VRISRNIAAFFGSCFAFNKTLLAAAARAVACQRDLSSFVASIADAIVTAKGSVPQVLETSYV
jgi:hypothetical protein